MKGKLIYRREGNFVSKIKVFPGGEGEIELAAEWDGFEELAKAKALLGDKQEVIVEEEQ